MRMIEHYNKLYEEAIEKIKSDNYQIDNLINSAYDNRFGITLLIRLDNKIKNNIQKFLSELQTAEPGQYYYPDSDIHLTVLSIISCHNGFDLRKISIPDYVRVIKKCLKVGKSIKIIFNGLTASSSCIMVRGFLKDNTLNQIRNNLREGIKKSSLQQSIDERYQLQTAHSTVVRFRKHLQNKNDFLKILEKYRDYDFGSFTADTIELVYNDWYQRKKYVKELYKFKII